MNLALNYCWKEWRAQRGLLTAYTLLVFACLCLALYLAPRHYWFEDDFGVHALSWFVGVGVIGVAAFVVPSLVRGEFTSKEDQFVRRLPNALLPSFFGKLLFLVLATLTLPLLGLLAGEAFVTSLGHGWEGLYGWNWDGTVFLKPPTLVIAASGFALLLLPWIWAAGTWTPGGRLALLTTVLLVLVVSVLAFAVVRQSPGVLARVPWESWLWTVPVSGLLAAAASWCKGRRGGGAMRSARFGLLATAVTLLPGGAWLGQRAWFYHHPRSDRLERMHVWGISPDERHLLAYVSEGDEWQVAPVRIDMQSGAMTQIGSTDYSVLAGVERPFLASYHQHRSRYWHDSMLGGGLDVFDLTTGLRQVVGYDKKRHVAKLSSELREEVRADRIANTPFRGPGGSPVWLDHGFVCTKLQDGSVRKQPWDIGNARLVAAAGLGIKLFGTDQLYDLVQDRVLVTKKTEDEYVVGDSLVFRQKNGNQSKWFVQQAGQQAAPCHALLGTYVVGLFDDTRLLACRSSLRRSGTPLRLFLFAPDDGVVTELELPQDAPFETMQRAEPPGLGGSLLARDPEGCVWLACRSYAKSEECFARIDPDSLQVRTLLPHGRTVHGYAMQLLSYRDLPSIVVVDGLEIVRMHLESGERTVLFSGNPSDPRSCVRVEPR